MSNVERNRQQIEDEQEKDTQNVSLSNDAVEEDGTPVLDEQDLEENNLTAEEADNIEWDDESA